ncbi:tetratricopeptide repeat protein, partial [Shewanella sp.]
MKYLITVIFTVALLLSNAAIATQSIEEFNVTKNYAEQGNATAQYNFGRMYFSGNGVKRDDNQARLWFEKAADQGHADAQHTLGLIYNVGEGVRQDYDKARLWYEKAANQGHADAQYTLGLIYNVGEGVRQDY